MNESECKQETPSCISAVFCLVACGFCFWVMTVILNDYIATKKAVEELQTQMKEMRK
jgi:hypothetical protein